MTVRRFLLRSAFVLFATTASLPAYVRVMTVSGPSEAPTLLLGDRVLINYAAYDVCLPYSSLKLFTLAEPRRGDLVLFDVPGKDLGIKRVIGLPGDKVELRENQLLLNGKAISAETLDPAGFKWVPAVHNLGTHIVKEHGFDLDEVISYSPNKSPVASFGPVVVPAGWFFLLGHHRDNSNDSRYFGPIGRQRIHGQVIHVLRSSRSAG
jgi:signal peptidase I